MQQQSLSILVLLILCLFSNVGCSEDTSVRGLAYKYEKNGQSGYLMGSVHFGDASFYPLSPAIMQGFDESAVLVVEIDDATITLEQRQNMMAKHGLYPEDETLADHLSARTMAIVHTLLEEFALPFDAVAQHKPGFLATVLMVMQAQKLGFRGDLGIDQFFLDKARGNKVIREIENFEFQMQLLGSMPDEDSILFHTFGNMNQYQALWSDMIAAWKSGDAESLYALTIGNELKAHPELAPYYRILFFDRHPRMLDSVQACIDQKDACFVVVGAGHLVGEEGLVEGLKRRGYTVSQL